VDVLRPLGDAHMREDGAELLRQAGHVQRGDALAVEMRRHADQRADGDHAGAADAGDEDAPGLLCRGQCGLGRAAKPRSSAAPALPFLSRPPSTVTKLGQKPFRQV
jgi:hypothetical protein